MKSKYSLLKNLSGWVVFAISFMVFALTAERSGSLWDVGEFIAGAYKLQVVHPPGAPLFLLIGRLFSLIGELFLPEPSGVAFAVNLLSAISTAFGAMFTGWIAIHLGRLTLAGRDGRTDLGENIALFLVGIVAGLTSAFATSVWFSAVEGEVYALSTFFTMLTLWSIVKWYSLPDKPGADRWLLLSFFAIGSSIGVHLLSVLVIPSLALFYYFKKSEKTSFRGIVLATLAGIFSLMVIQKGVIVGLPVFWSKLELFTVNSLGWPVHSGLIPLLLILGMGFFFGLRYAWKKKQFVLERVLVAMALVIIGYSTIMVVVIRAGADPPINMNNPDNVFSLIPYINRDQYGERPIFKGPQFDKQPIRGESEEQYGLVGGKYEVTGQKVKPVYRAQDEVLFPRMSSSQTKDVPIYRRYWMKHQNGTPTLSDNLGFLLRYQVGWMYMRYFMWNFVGRLDGDQGYIPSDWTAGHWVSGIPFLDRLFKFGFYDYSEEPLSEKKDESRNFYFYLPFIFGLIGLLWHLKRRKGDFFTLFAFFIITGVGIIIYSNQPPLEPRERDYVLVGSFMAFAIWIGMAVLAIHQILVRKFPGKVPAIMAGITVLTVPVIMGVENFDDHDRSHLSGARDFANNFLESCEENAIIFTYADNDTYPLWYAQEVEGIRTDVRVVNLNLLGADWYINSLRRRVNDSLPVKLTHTQEALRGSKRVNVPYQEGKPRPLNQILAFSAKDNPVTIRGNRIESYLPTNRFYIDVDPEDPAMDNIVTERDSMHIVKRMDGVIDSNNNYLRKDQLTVLDIIANNWKKRPIYWSNMAPEEKLFGLQKYLRMEGLGKRLVPIHGNDMVNLEKLHENVMKKFRWGTFDKVDQNVASGFRGTINVLQTMFRSGVNQATFRYGSENDPQEKERYRDIGIDLVDTYFESFQRFNFPYDPGTMIYAKAYLEFDIPEKAVPVFSDLIDCYEDQLNFLDSLNQSAIQSGFIHVKERWEGSIPILARLIAQTKNIELIEKMHNKLGGFADLSRFQI